MSNETLTTKEAAARLGVSVGRIRQLVLSGTLAAEKFGRDLLIRSADLEGVKTYGKPGRPKKADEAEAIEATRKSAPVKAKKRAVKKAKN